MKNLIILAIFCVQIFALDIVNGDVEILRLGKEIDKILLDSKEIKLMKNPVKNNEKIAILSANYRQKNDMKLTFIQNGISKTKILNLKKGDYKSEILKVAPSKVKPPQSVSARIKKEYDEAVAIYAKTGEKYLFDKPFILPLNSKITSNFGNARTFNSELKSYHSGTDYRASIGTNIVASNDGIVKIAKDRYYAGGSVIIDHGGGIYSQYYHLSEILVSVGQKVKRGELIAKSGATGRVNGPHLHFGIAINQNSVNPINFIKKINKVIFE